MDRYSSNLSETFRIWHLKCLKNLRLAGLWWHMPLIPLLWRQRQVDLVSSRPAWYQELVSGQAPKLLRNLRNHVLKNKKQKQANKQTKNQNKKLRTYHDNETHLLLAAPICFKRKMGIKEALYGVA